MGILVSVNCNAQRAIGWKAKGSLNAEHDPEYVEVIGMESNRCAKVGCFIALSGVRHVVLFHDSADLLRQPRDIRDHN